MLLLIPHGYAQAAPGTVPNTAGIATMMKSNEVLGRAGVLLRDPLAHSGERPSA
jgi:hypothetical protein